MTYNRALFFCAKACMLFRNGLPVGEREQVNAFKILPFTLRDPLKLYTCFNLMF
jgi:hypothetical protein